VRNHSILKKDSAPLSYLTGYNSHFFRMSFV